MPAAKGNKYSQKYTPEMIEELCEELISFATEDETVHFVEFARRNKKTQTWLNRMAEDYPQFAQAYEDAQELLSTKLVRSSIYGHPINDKFSGTHAMNWMRVYSKTYRNYEKHKAELARQKDENIKATADQIIQAIKDDKLLELLAQKDD